ncbi:hypothetical protein B0H34DRAFT_715981, partial [Crassisporium funariophilum]
MLNEYRNLCMRHIDHGTPHIGRITCRHTFPFSTLPDRENGINSTGNRLAASLHFIHSIPPTPFTMFVPFISSPNLVRRKGGGKGSSSSSSGKAGKSSASSSSSTKSSKSKTKTIKSSSGSKFKSSSTYGNRGTPPPMVIPAGQMFAGRIAGGGTRSQIFGTKTYGSGYPGVVGRGTAGRGFPFVFWPIAWPLAIGGGIGTAVYLHNNLEYGHPTNSSRPGGALSVATFPSSSSGSTFHILSDNSTVLSLIEDLSANCTSLLSSSRSTTSTPYTSTPQPEQVIQYYRSSTIALSLDGYNNTATYAPGDGAPDSPFPEGLDLRLMDCLNQTIGLAAPLIDGAVGARCSSNAPIGMVGVVWIAWWLLGL